MIPSIEQHTGFHITNQHVFSEGYVVVFNAAYPKKAKQEYSRTTWQQT